MDPAQASNRRIAIVDALRGWALLSVALVNFAIFYSLESNTRIPAGDTASHIAKLVTQVFFQSKGWTLLAFLFGYGFSVLIERLRTTDRPALAYSRRMFWLLLIAIVNCALYYGDVLKDYVLVGMIILAFHRVRVRTAALMALACLLTFPALIPWSRGLELSNPIVAPISLFESHRLVDVLKYGLLSGVRMSLSLTKYFDWDLVMLACAFAGMACQRSGFFETLSNRRRQLKILCFGGLGFAIASAATGTAVSAAGLDLHNFYDIQMWPMLGQMICFAAAFCWLYIDGRFPHFFEAMRLVGRMTLTNYMLQNLLGMLIFSGVGLVLLHRIPYWAHIVIALVVFVTQVWFSYFWLTHWSMGPIERLWRTLSAQAPRARANVAFHS